MHADRQKLLAETQSKFLFRALVVWLIFITVESVLGHPAVVFLEPRMGGRALCAMDRIRHRVGGSVDRRLLTTH
jgi:hypothetical protein